MDYLKILFDKKILAVYFKDTKYMLEIELNIKSEDNIYIQSKYKLDLLLDSSITDISEVFYISHNNDIDFCFYFEKQYSESKIFYFLKTYISQKSLLKLESQDYFIDFIISDIDGIITNITHQFFYSISESTLYCFNPFFNEYLIINDTIYNDYSNTYFNVKNGINLPFNKSPLLLRVDNLLPDYPGLTQVQKINKFMDTIKYLNNNIKKIRLI